MQKEILEMKIWQIPIDFYAFRGWRGAKGIEVPKNKIKNE